MIGIDLAKHIRTLQEEGELDKKTKLVLISGDNIYSNHFKKQSPLFDDMLQKPFTIAQLRSLLKKQNFIIETE
jgi:CheY-like chemotaxis protein